MKKIFEKHETLFCILLIVLYIVSNSVCVQNFGYTSAVSFVVNTALSALLICLVIALKRGEYYGFARVRNKGKYLYFIPLLLLVSVNLWNGVNIDKTPLEITFHILTMLNIGFIEELIFRGFLFKMMAKDNVKLAIFVSSVTFGAGHIINLFTGADILPTLMQICYATATGYLFVVIFHKSGSLIPCIITHSLVNSLSVFNVENTVSQYIAPVFLTVVPLAYALYINKMTDRKPQ
ncbi:MAG: CPBP family intramembrane metalloprotease [Clostridia bacterium]|nr:CPBP family intramembrane metalloprotease [Clostridia bacterium]MBQ9121728.1 CPBP family intramembrane metalloprotease [Clostridia bacterium]